MLTGLRQSAWSRYQRINSEATGVSIIANNCWGGFVYQRFGARYETPFVGLYMLPDCYLRLLEDLDKYLATPLQFIPNPQGSYPLGVLDGDVTLHFLHALSAVEAANDWARRLSRLNRESLAVKMCDRDGCTAEHIRRFAALPYVKKVCFVSRPVDVECAVYVPGFEAQGQVPTDLHQRMDQHFDISHWLKSGRIRRPGISHRALHRVLCH